MSGCSLLHGGVNTCCIHAAGAGRIIPPASPFKFKFRSGKASMLPMRRIAGGESKVPAAYAFERLGSTSAMAGIAVVAFTAMLYEVGHAVVAQHGYQSDRLGALPPEQSIICQCRSYQNRFARWHSVANPKKVKTNQHFIIVIEIISIVIIACRPTDQHGDGNDCSGGVDHDATTQMWHGDCEISEADG